jgi:hypothetical protein
VLVKQFVFLENRFDNENAYNDDFHRLVSKEFFAERLFLDEVIRFLAEDSE